MCRFESCFVVKYYCTNNIYLSLNPAGDMSSVESVNATTLKKAKKMNVLIADDEVLLRDALAGLIKLSDPTSIIKTCGNFHEIAGYLKTHSEIDTVLIDLYMPGTNALKGPCQVMREFPDHFVILMSGAASEADIVNCYNAGIHGFIPKSIQGRAVVAAIQLVQCGERCFPASMSHRRAETGPTFTEREMRVLRELQAGGTNKIIALSLGIDEASVKGALRTAGRRLGARTRTEIALRSAKHMTTDAA